MSLNSTNPATGEIFASYDEMTLEKVDSIIYNVSETQKSWKKTSFRERKDKLKRAAEILRDRKNEFGKIMTHEMGKPLSQAIAEAEKCAWVCDYYADNAENMLKDHAIETDASSSFISHQPLGVVLAVMPWNFPFWQVFRFAAPALMAGNGGLLKHASNVQGCAIAIEGIFREAGFPTNIFRTLVIGSRLVEGVIRNPLVKAVSLTGSGPAGSAVASSAGSVIKKVVLELGGNDPYIVLADADIDQAVNACATGRLLNTGQSCIAAKRYIVEKPVLQEFTRKIVEKFSNMELGDPMSMNATVGPLVNTKARDEVHKQVHETVSQGAAILTGGQIPEGPGAFYPPTVIAGVKPGMTAFKDEIFGPVATIIEAYNEDHAIEMANDSIFGLGAAVFTGNVEKGTEIACNRLEAGSCFVNDFVRSDPRLPFGGIKESGYGRELSHLGILEFVNAKTVYVR